MDTVDTYTQRRLLFKCDNSISKIYTNLFKILSQSNPLNPSSSQSSSIIDQSIKSQTIKQIDSVIFQIFKYKTALLTIQKDIQDNQQQQIHANTQIQNSKKQIIKLTEHVKSAQLVRKRKLEYNQIARSVKDFGTMQELSNKILEICNQVEKLENQYRLDMEGYAEKERCIRLALSSLRVLMRDDNNQADGY